MNEFWRRLIEMERRQDRANHMMARSSEQIEQAKVDNYKGGIFSPIQNVGNLQPGYGVIGTYPFGFDGLWVSADFESSEPAFTGPSPSTAQSRRCLAVHQYDRGEEWAGWTDQTNGQNLPFLSRTQGRSYPFKVTWDTSASAAGSKWVFKYDGGNMLASYAYRIFQGMSFTYDWKRGQLRIQASIEAYDRPECHYAVYLDYGSWPKDASVSVDESIVVRCDHWIDFDPDNPPFSGDAGSITVPGTMQQTRKDISKLPTAMVISPKNDEATPIPLPEHLNGYPYDTYYPPGSGFGSTSDIDTTGPATFTFRWDKPTAECFINPYNLIPPRIPNPDYPNDPTQTIPNPNYVECIYKHWDEYDN
jgi:hypothetical protein